MGKRANNTAVAKSGNKKAKTEAAFECIIEIINQAEQLSPNCRAMLIEMLPFSLSFHMDMRHELQNKAVNMVEETLCAKKLVLEAQITTETEKLDKLKASEEELLNNVKACESAVSMQKEVLETSKRFLAEADVAANTTSAALEEKLAAQKLANEKIMKSKEEKAALESAFMTHLKEPFEKGLHYKELVPFIKQLNLEASLLTALPTSCVKPKEQRGGFDNLVLQELEKSFLDKILALTASVEADTPALSEHEVAVQAAEKECEETKARRNVAASELESAQKEQDDREEALNKAKVALNGFQPQLQLLVEQVESAREALSSFESGAMATFVNYKTQKTSGEEAAPLQKTNGEEAAPLGA